MLNPGAEAAEARRADLEDIRTIIYTLVDKPVHFKIDQGRTRVQECPGKVCQAHPATFVVNLELRRNNFKRISYQYIDVLCGKIVLKHHKTREVYFPQFVSELLAD